MQEDKQMETEVIKGESYKLFLLYRISYYNTSNWLSVIGKCVSVKFVVIATFKNIISNSNSLNILIQWKILLK